MNQEIICYTCITNGKDTLKDYATEDGIRYICFTDGSVDAVDGWEMVDLVWQHEDPRRSARYHKILAHKVLPEHSYSLWIDGALYPRVRIHDLIKWCDNLNYFARRHPGWNSLYDEAEAILHYGFEDPDVVYRVIERYRSENVPDDIDLHETGTLIRKNETVVKMFDIEWWNEVENGSKRDQLSFDYVKWKHDFQITELSKNWFGVDGSIGWCGHKHKD